MHALDAFVDAGDSKMSAEYFGQAMVAPVRCGLWVPFRFNQIAPVLAVYQETPIGGGIFLYPSAGLRNHPVKTRPASNHAKTNLAERG